MYQHNKSRRVNSLIGMSVIIRIDDHIDDNDNRLLIIMATCNEQNKFVKKVMNKIRLNWARIKRMVYRKMNIEETMYIFS